MEYGNRFKRSLFGGFRRQDVLKCFDEFSAEKTDEIAELNRQIQELQGQLSDRDEKLGSAEKEAAQIREEQENLREKLAECEKILEIQKTQLLSVGDAKSKAESESKASIQLLKERDVKIAFLEDKAKKLTLKLEESERKGQKYDSLSIEIGEMMLEAKASAEAIIHQAEAKSEQVTADTTQAVGQLSADLTLFLQQLNHIKATMHTLTDGVDTKIQSLEASISSTQDNLSAFQKSRPVSPKRKEEHSTATRQQTEPRTERQSGHSADSAEREQTNSEPGQTGQNRIGKTINRLIDLIGRD